MSNIGLIDVDGAKKTGNLFPNLALMKLSAWHQAQGDRVEWCFPLKRYDRVYASKIFTFTPDIDFDPLTDDFRKGGTGYFYPDGGDPLPYEIEHIMPDYSLYGITDAAYGFLTRGCPRACPFCIVSKKEGRRSYRVSELSEWWNGQKYIKLLDPNLTACPDCLTLLDDLVASRAIVDFTQGLDIRLMRPEIIDRINRIRIKEIHFAWDNPDHDLSGYFRDYAKLAKHKPHGEFGTVYYLVNYNSTLEQDLDRIYTLRDLGYTPYIMIYEKWNAPRKILHLQRWVNNKILFRACKKFEDYSYENRKLNRRGVQK